ncbi:MAG: hypothetical protein M0D53_12420 [Flavobacterium sp. JAD_PAG50586_2]|nr:MAG: hypothetical protein M0D53_12420 [Flavobacterium sp. JAD_PAG50586_2]
MRISKISSKATYHKCLKALHAQGYIKYEPSYNPFKGSHVFLFNFSENLKPLSKSEKATTPIFEPVDEQVVNKPQAGNETASEQVAEQVVVPYINNTNITNDLKNSNNLNLGEHEKKLKKSNSFLEKMIVIQKKKVPLKKKCRNSYIMKIGNRLLWHSPTTSRSALIPVGKRLRRRNLMKYLNIFNNKTFQKWKPINSTIISKA